MNTDTKNWFESTLLKQDKPDFERLGSKRVIFKVDHRAPLACMFVDSTPEAPIAWKTCPGLSRIESFFARLAPLVESHQCTWFFVSMPQDEYTVLRWVAPVSEKSWSPSKLYAFENTGAEGGKQSLCLSFENRALLVFTLKDGFEIAYFGSDKLWEQIASVLYGGSETSLK